MCIFNSRISTADEDFPAIKKKKSRNPKPRDKWSLLWFIPSQTLNIREDITDSRGTVVRRGKRIGFDSFNSLSCKLCHKSFHKKPALSFHNQDQHNQRSKNTKSVTNLSRLSGNASSGIKRKVSEVTKVPVEPARKSSRLSGRKPVNYDDDIEIIEVEVVSKRTDSKATNIEQKNFSKLSLSAQRKVVEKNTDVEPADVKSKQTKTRKRKANDFSKPVNPKASKVSKDIEVIDVDESANKKKDYNKNSKVIKKGEEEKLLAEETDTLKEIKMKETKKRKPGKNSPQDMIEVKSASGKSMIISKAVLEKVMSSKGIQSKVQKPFASKRSTDEKLLAEENDLA